MIESYWRGLLDWIAQTQLAEGTISPEDLDLLVLTDSVEEARDILVDCYRRRCWSAARHSIRAEMQRRAAGADGNDPDRGEGRRRVSRAGSRHGIDRDA